MLNPRDLLRRLSPPTCPEAQRKTCVIGLVWMLVLGIYTIFVAQGCYISWNNGVLEVGEGNRPTVLQPPPVVLPVVPK